MKRFRDPATGDELTAGEHISWLIQSVIRRWPFLIIVTLATLLAWATNNPTVLLWWNLAASYLAIMIESIVGIAMFSQTKRDAVVMREVRTLARQHEQALARVIALEEQTEKQTEMLLQLLKEQAEIKRQTGISPMPPSETSRAFALPHPIVCEVCGLPYHDGTPGWYGHVHYEGDRRIELAFCSEEHLKSWLATWEAGRHD